MNHTLVPDELDVLVELLPTPGTRVIELGCGGARMARQMLQRWPDMRYLGLEVDLRQHAINLQDTPPRMRFAVGGAQAIACDDAQFDLALMLKSLHHVPLTAMDQALAEVARVLRPGAFFYVSEPIYGGALNALVRLYNDEGVVRPAAQAALDRALASGGRWEALAERRFAQPVHFADFDDFAQRMMFPSFADHQIDDALLAQARAAYAPHQRADGASLVRPLHVRVLRRRG